MRSHIRKFFFCIALFLIVQLQAKAQTYQLVWSDEFNGSIGPDWVFETGAGGWETRKSSFTRSKTRAFPTEIL